MTTPRIPGSKIAAAKSSTTNKPRRRRQYRVRGCFIDIMNNKHFNVNYLSSKLSYANSIVLSK